MAGQVIITSFMYLDPPLFSPNTETGNKRGSPHLICSPVRYDSCNEARLSLHAGHSFTIIGNSDLHYFYLTLPGRGF